MRGRDDFYSPGGVGFYFPGTHQRILGEELQGAAQEKKREA